MADTRTITLRQGHGTASTIVLRALPIPDVGTTTIVLRGLHATPATIILRNPLTLPEGGGGPTIIEADANSSGISTVSGLAAAIWNGAGVSEGSAPVSGIAATVLSSLASSSGSSVLGGIAGAIWSILADASGGSTAAAESEDSGNPPTIIITGGDDAPKSRRKRRKETHDTFREMEATIHGLLHPGPETVQEVGVEPVAAGAARHALDELVVLAQGQHDLLQRAAALRAELKQLEDARARMLEQDEEDALIWMF